MTPTLDLLADVADLDGNARLPVREAAQVGYAHKQHHCGACDGRIDVGSPNVTAYWGAKHSRVRKRYHVDCAPFGDVLPASALAKRRAGMLRRVAETGRRGRPALVFSAAEVELVARLRGVQDLGQGRLAAAFLDMTGRRVSARKLATIGLDWMPNF